MNKDDSKEAFKTPVGYYSYKRSFTAGFIKIYRNLRQDLKESRLNEYYTGFANEADKGISLGDILCFIVALCLLPLIPMFLGFMVFIFRS